MAGLPYPDFIYHNNPDKYLVDSDFIKGAPRVVADTAALYALASKSDQLKQYVTKVFVQSANTDYRLIDDTNIGNSSGWQAVSFIETDPIFTASPAFGITYTNITNWNTAFGWGNHATAGYALQATTITATGSGITGGGSLAANRTISLDFTYLDNRYQPLNADLTAIAALSGTSGFLKKTGSGTWALDTNTYLTANQNITISGDVTGSGTTAITATVVWGNGYTTYDARYPQLSGSYADPSWISSLAWSKITGAPSFVTSLAALTDVNLTSLADKQFLRYDSVSSKWINVLLTSTDIPNLDMSKITTGNLAWSRISSTPTTLSGYGITDATPSSRSITVNGVTFNLSADRTFPDATNATNITSGTLPDARLSSNVVMITGAQTISGQKTFSTISPLMTFMTPTADAMVQINSSSVLSAPNLIVEGAVTDSDIISAILGATYTNAGSYIASITPASSKVFNMGAWYNGGGFHYFAVANNVVYRFGISDTEAILNQTNYAQNGSFNILGSGIINTRLSIGTASTTGTLNITNTATQTIASGIFYQGNGSSLSIFGGTSNVMQVVTQSGFNIGASSTTTTNGTLAAGRTLNLKSFNDSSLGVINLVMGSTNALTIDATANTTLSGSLTANSNISINVSGTTAMGLLVGGSSGANFMNVRGAGNMFSNTAVNDTAIRSGTVGSRIALGTGTTTATAWIDGNSITIGTIINSATAALKLPTGTNTLAPLLIPNGGTLLSSPVAGMIETDASHIYYTIGSTRYQLDQQTPAIITFTGENYISGTSPSFTVNAINVSGTNITGVLKQSAFPALLGDVTTSSGSLTTTIANNAVTTAKINNSAVTYAKIQNVSAPSKLIGRFTAGAGAPEEITISTGLSLDGSGNLTGTIPKYISWVYSGTGTTVAGTGGVFTAGGSTNQISSHFSFSSGRATYSGSTKLFRIGVTVGISGTVGDLIQLRIAKNGSSISNTTVKVRLDSTGINWQGFVHYIDSVANTDYYEVYALNDTNTANSITICFVNFNMNSIN